jgi:hypothetical protein
MDTHPLFPQILAGIANGDIDEYLRFRTVEKVKHVLNNKYFVLRLMPAETRLLLKEILTTFNYPLDYWETEFGKGI